MGKIWAISDLHFTQTGKPSMEGFGDVWKDYRAKIIHNWKTYIGAEDTVLCPGDISWGKTLDDAKLDLNEIESLPGRRKVFIRGNHDMWWKNAASLNKVFSNSMCFIGNEPIEIEDCVIAGTMGWISPNDPVSDPLDVKPYAKQIQKAKNRLASARKLADERGLPIIGMFHFPPFTTVGQKNPFFDLLVEYRVSDCVCGHFHYPAEWETFPKKPVEGVNVQLCSTDYLNHRPILLRG